MLIAELQSWQQLRSQASRELRAMAMQPQFCVPFLQLGRLVFISDPTHSSAAARWDTELMPSPLFALISVTEGGGEGGWYRVDIRAVDLQ